MKVALIVIGVIAFLFIVMLIRRNFFQNTPITDLTIIRENIMPRIVNETFIKDALKTYPEGLPCRPLYETGLSIVYVIDSKNNMSFVRAGWLKESGLTEAELYSLSIEHLRQRYPDNIASKTLKSNSLIVLKTFDGFDAARLLLVPAQLEAGQSIAATIPDRDTLSLSPVPLEDNWAGLRKASQSAVGAPLCEQPLLVTSNSIIKK